MEAVQEYSNRGRHYQNRLLRLVEIMHKHQISGAKQQVSRKPKHQPQRVDRRINAEQIQSLITGYKQGKSSAALGIEFGISKTSVIELLRKNAVRIQNSRISIENQRLAIHLYRNGMSLAKVGQRIGVSASAVRNLLLRNGFSTRSK